MRISSVSRSLILGAGLLAGSAAADEVHETWIFSFCAENGDWVTASAQARSDRPVTPAQAVAISRAFRAAQPAIGDLYQAMYRDRATKSDARYENDGAVFETFYWRMLDVGGRDLARNAYIRLGRFQDPPKQCGMS